MKTAFISVVIKSYKIVKKIRIASMCKPLKIKLNEAYKNVHIYIYIGSIRSIHAPQRFIYYLFGFREFTHEVRHNRDAKP